MGGFQQATQLTAADLAGSPCCQENEREARVFPLRWPCGRSAAIGSTALTGPKRRHRLWPMPTAGGYDLGQPEGHVRLFRNGRNQAIRIPRDLELEGEEAIIHKEGDRLIVEPVRKGWWLAPLATLAPLDEPFPDVDDDLQPLEMVPRYLLDSNILSDLIRRPRGPVAARISTVGECAVCTSVIVAAIVFDAIRPSPVDCHGACAALMPWARRAIQPSPRARSST